MPSTPISRTCWLGSTTVAATVLATGEGQRRLAEDRTTHHQQRPAEVGEWTAGKGRHQGRQRVEDAGNGRLNTRNGLLDDRGFGQGRRRDADGRSGGTHSRGRDSGNSGGRRRATGTSMRNPEAPGPLGTGTARTTDGRRGRTGGRPRPGLLRCGPNRITGAARGQLGQRNVHCGRRTGAAGEGRQRGSPDAPNPRVGAVGATPAPATTGQALPSSPRRPSPRPFPCHLTQPRRHPSRWAPPEAGRVRMCLPLPACRSVVALSPPQPLRESPADRRSKSTLGRAETESGFSENSQFMR